MAWKKTPLPRAKPEGMYVHCGTLYCPGVFEAALAPEHVGVVLTPVTSARWECVFPALASKADGEDYIFVQVSSPPRDNIHLISFQGFSVFKSSFDSFGRDTKFTLTLKINFSLVRLNVSICTYVLTIVTTPCQAIERKSRLN